MLGPKPLDLEPSFISIEETARHTSESIWKVKDRLRAGEYLAKKSGRRTLVNFASVKGRLANLPDAKYAPPRERKAVHPGAGA
jgi:hypothetical protein